MRRVPSFVLWLCVVMAPAARLWACSCVSGPPVCRPLAIHGAMFLGEVLSLRDLNKNTDAPTSSFLSRAFRFRVIESFAGGQRNGEEVEVRTGHGGGDCGYGFVVGQRYLVDAYSGSNLEGAASLTTGICSVTGPEDLSKVALIELRARASGTRIPDLSGQVLSVEGIGDLGNGERRPLSGIAVTVTELPKGPSYHAFTDDAGIYNLSTVPPGAYGVSFALPPTRAAWESEDGKPIVVTIPVNDGAGASCHVSVHAAPSGTIAGQIVDGAGRGLKGFVAAYPAAQANSRSWAAASPSDEEGRFQLDFLKDGSYRLVYSAEKSFQRQFVSQVKVEQGHVAPALRLSIPP